MRTHAWEWPTRRVRMNDLVDPVFGGGHTSVICVERLVVAPLMQCSDGERALSVRLRVTGVFDFRTDAATGILKQPGWKGGLQLA